MCDVIPSQVDPGGAQFGQHYELFNERVIAALSSITATRSACGDATIGEALAAAGIRRDHDTSMAHACRRTGSPETAQRHDVP
jgi:hypothetical protein